MQYEVSNFNNAFAFYEKPINVGSEIIEGVIEVQKFNKTKVKDLFANTNTDGERANWADLLVPDSARHTYQDTEYRMK